MFYPNEQHHLKKILKSLHLVIPLCLSPGIVLFSHKSVATEKGGADSVYSSDWLHKAQEEIAGMEYEVTWQEDYAIPDGKPGYHIANRAQDLRAYFYPDEIAMVRRTATEPTWVFRFQLQEVMSNGMVSPLPYPRIKTKENAIEYDHKGLVQRYINKESGVECIYTLPKDKHRDAPVRLKIKTNEGLASNISSNGRAIVFSHNQEEVIQFGNVRGSDAHGTPLDVKFASSDGGFEIVIEEENLIYPLTVTASIIGFPPRYAWMGQGDQSYCYFGYSVASAGDVNGDGFDDLIVGAWDYDNGQFNEGAVFVWYGSVQGLGAYGQPYNADWQAESNQQAANFGKSVASAGDVNGDGYDDIIVGCLLYDLDEHTPENEGAALIWFGGPEGLGDSGYPGNADWFFGGTEANAQFGTSVACAGDVNGDEYDDVIIGAPEYSYNGYSSGQVYLFHGSPTGPRFDTADWRALSNVDDSRIGYSVATAGDVNGDGFDDILISDIRYSNGQNYEGAAFVWHGSVTGIGPDGDGTNYDWKVEGDQQSALFGYSLSTAGDVNGDGYDDVIIGSYSFDSGETDEGKSFVYHGSPTGLSTSPSWSAESDEAYARLGYSVAKAGDVNGDGYDDIIIGGYSYGIGGGAEIYIGGPGGLSVGEPDWKAFGPHEDSNFGICVSSAGDVNGDGTDDVVIGANVYKSGTTAVGGVFVYYGCTSDWIVEGGQAYAELGTAVSTAGDVNGDGFSDVIIGAPGYDNGQTNEGAVFFYEGSPAGPSTSPDWSAESNRENAYFGSAVATAGDVNGDSFSDILIGASDYGFGYMYEGAAYLWFGSSTGLGDNGTPDNADWKVEGKQNYGYLGKALSTAGDINGDGYSDILIGMPEYSNTEDNEGAVFVWLGSATGPGGDGTPGGATWHYESNTLSAMLGESVCTAGDVNGDGYSDIIAGAPFFPKGKAFVFHGSSSGLGSSPDWEHEGDLTNSSFGSAVATAGDVNGDGYSDVLIGAPYYGYGYAFLFHGSATGLSATENWYGYSPQSGSRFGTSVCTAGDLNDDGYADVMVGDPEYSNGQTHEGVVCIWYGSATGLGIDSSASNADLILECNQIQSRFGSAAFVAGDVNGDGYSDVIVGAPGYRNSASSEGAAFIYYGSDRGVSTTPDWTVKCDQSGSDMGLSVASAGDVNGDGYADVIVGAPLYDNCQVDEGRVFVYLGSSNGLSPAPDWSAESNVADAWFGWSVASAGDINGDGMDEVIVGAPYYTNGETNEGVVALYYGGASGLSTIPNWTVEGNRESQLLGFCVATAGDVNGDGFSDIIIGTHGTGIVPAAFVYHGSSVGLSSAPNWTVTREKSLSFLGKSVSTAGDVNGDGFSDVIMGAYSYDAVTDSEGRAVVFHGSPAGLHSTPGWTFEGDQESGQVGYAVSTAGDVNGDGYADVAVTAPLYDSPQENEGRVMVFHGSAAGLSDSYNWVAEGDVALAYFGWSVGTAGDVNGDGYADLIVGARGYSNGETREGKAYIYSGSHEGLESEPCWTYESNRAEAQLGKSVGTAGDVNGDGYADIVVGAPDYFNEPGSDGRAVVFYGNSGQGFHAYPRQLRTDNGKSIAHLGRTNSTDSFMVSLRGKSYSGRTKAKLEVEVKHAGTLFNGIDLQQTDTWTDTGIGATVLQKVSDQLNSGSPYHWRARFRFHPASSPFQQASRWVTIPWHGCEETLLRTAPVKHFTFDTDTEGWEFVGPVPPYDTPITFAEKVLAMNPQQSTNCFSYWYSPDVLIKVGRTYRAQWVVGSTCVEKDDTVQHRLRINQKETWAGWDRIVNSEQSQGSALGSPESYSMIFAPRLTGLHDNLIVFSFDILSFNQYDTTTAWIYLEELTLDEILIGTGAQVVYYSFDTGSDGWTFQGNVPPFASAISSVESSRLGLSPNGSDYCFSYWFSPDIELEEGKIYRALFEMTSSIEDEDKAVQFRLRVNQKGSWQSWDHIINSFNRQGPCSKGMKTYQLFFMPEITGETDSGFVLSTDIVSFSSDDDVNSWLYFENIRLEEIFLLH